MQEEQLSVGQEETIDVAIVYICNVCGCLYVLLRCFFLIFLMSISRSISMVSVTVAPVIKYGTLPGMKRRKTVKLCLLVIWNLLFTESAKTILTDAHICRPCSYLYYELHVELQYIVAVQSSHSPKCQLFMS